MKNENIINVDDLKAIIRDLFIVYHRESFDNAELNNICSSSPPALKSAASAFISNISGCVSTISIPFTMAIASSSKLLYDRCLLTKAIPHYILNGTMLSKSEIKDHIKKEFETINTSKESIEKLSKEVCSFLYDLHQDKEMAEAAAELLRQGTVLIWGALENLSRDIFETIINTHPLLGKQLIDEPTGRKYFQIKTIDFDTLGKFDFDISSKLGSILVQNQDFSNLAAIRATFNVLFPENEQLRTALSSTELWILNQRRHLIVHKRGVVDQHYIDKTGDSLTTGERLCLFPEELKKYLTLVQNVGAKFIDATKILYD